MKAIAVSILLTISGVYGDISFSKYYGDHMVLQRAPKHAIITGRATKIGDTVTVTVGNNAAHGKSRVVSGSGGQGFWKVKLTSVDQEGPFNLTAVSSEGIVTLTGVLFGDVWVCSGQSNMEFNMRKVMNSSAEIKHALSFSKLRIFKTDRNTSPTPLTDLASVKIPWTKPTTDALHSFSAVCFMFGERLIPHLNYPIGLVESDWGGTSLNWWSSPHVVSSCPYLHKRSPPKNSELWNAMINPLLSMAIYGVLWYQGENDSGHAGRYACSFPAMIADWRKQWHHESLAETPANMPFGFVQLAALRNNNTMRGGWPDLRWAQTADYGYVPNPKMKNTFMAVAMDLPDFQSPYGPYVVPPGRHVKQVTHGTQPP